MRAAPIRTCRPSRSGPTIAAAALVMLVSASLGCVDPWLQPSVPSDPPPGSRIEYRPAPRVTRPKGPPAARPKPTLSTAPASILGDEKPRSTVRYEPITREPGPVSEDHDELALEVGDERPGEQPPNRVEPRQEPDVDHRDDDVDMHDVKLADLSLEDRPGRRDVSGRVVTPRVPKRPETVDASAYEPRFTEDGLAFPYPTSKMFRGFGPCRGTRHVHEGIDLGGVGPDWGVGTPIRSMARAEVTFIGLGKDNPDDFGLPDRRSGEALRGDRMLPRSRFIDPYGDVYFFTRKKGRWRSGNVVVTKALDGPLAGHVIRYMHLGGVHPDLEVGAVLEAGDELGLMGGTGVQESAPHLHLDITDPNGRRVDVAPLLGLPPTATCRKPSEVAATSELPDRRDRRRAETSRLEARADEGGEEVDEAGDVETEVAPRPTPRAPKAGKPANDKADNDKADNGDKADEVDAAEETEAAEGEAPDRAPSDQAASKPANADGRDEVSDRSERGAKASRSDSRDDSAPKRGTHEAPRRDDKGTKDDAKGREATRGETDEAKPGKGAPEGDGRRATLGGGRLGLVDCKSSKRNEDFGSGRFDAHALRVDLEKGQVLTVEVVRDGGSWKPRLEVVGEGVDAKTLATGKIGGKAVSSVRAKDKATVEVVVSGWGSRPPKDASYVLKVTDKCRKR